MSTNAYLANVRFESIAAGMGGKLPLIARCHDRLAGAKRAACDNGVDSPSVRTVPDRLQLPVRKWRAKRSSWFSLLGHQ